MKRFACVAGFLFTWALGQVWAQGPASTNAKLKERDNGNLVAAKKPEDELSLAMYFRELASQEKALADSYERIAAIYRNLKPPAGLDPESARKMENQYKSLAETEARAAAAAETVAAYHSRMADVGGSVPLAETHRTTDDAAFRK